MLITVPAHLLATNDELSTLFSKGDEEAFVEIYRRHWRRLFNSAYKRLKDEEQCEDIVQNVFADLWERRNGVEIANVEAYLTTAVRFKVINVSSRNLAKNHFVDLVENTLTSSLLTDSALLDDELSELLRLWLAALPEKRRKIFEMHFIQGLDTSRIAKLLGLSHKTIQNQLAVASGALRSHIFRLFLFAAATDTLTTL
jgi:RNA polymerase sigma-70 factor (family 1)